MTLRPSLTPACFLLLFSACAEGSKADPPAGFPYAYAVPDCAPWDGPAVTIYLTGVPADSLPPAGRYLQISLFTGRDELAGQRFTWPEDSRKGNLFECASIESCGPLGTGVVHITGVSGDSAVVGEMNLVTAAGDTIRGGFRAEWRPRRILCG